MTRGTLGAAARAFAATAALAVAAGPAAGQIVLVPQSPTFKSGVELIAVDVSVVDKAGVPVRGLGPDRFEVSVDGRPRRVVSAELVDHVPPRGAAALKDPPRPAYSSNDGPGGPTPVAPGRLMYVVVDEGSFRPASARGATEAARRFVDRLQPQDRVGLIAFPPPGKWVPPSANREAVREVLSRVVGSAQPLMETGSDTAVSLGEAVDIEAGDAFAFGRVSERECRGMRGTELGACQDRIRVEARSTSQRAEFQAGRTLSGLRQVVRTLGSVKERKTLVLISAGLPAADRFGGGLDTQAEIAAIARDAAAVNATIYILHIDLTFLEAFSASQGRPNETLSRDAAMLGTGLDTLAGASGGTLLRVTAGADFAFDRVLQETASSYVLAVEPAQGDYDGKPHAIKVGVTLPGTLIRSRREFVLTPRPAAAAIGNDPLTTALRAAQPATALPIGVSTHVLGSAGSGGLRVLITANVGRGLSEAVEARLAFTVTNSDGALVASHEEAKRLRVSRTSADGSASYASLAALPPGSYRLRIAALDAAGRAGSVDHPFTVGLRSDISAGDLLLMDPARSADEDLMAIADGKTRGRAVSAYLEFDQKAGEASPSAVSFAIAERADGPPLVQVKASGPKPDASGRSTVAARLDVSLVPPGDYVAVAVVSSGDKILGRRSQPLRIEAALPGAADAAASSPRVRFALGASSGLVKPFARTDVLSPDALGFFAGRLRSADPTPAAPGLEDAQAALTAGRFDAALSALAAAPPDTLSVAFLKGLALLGNGELEPAAAQFRGALRIADDFLPAAFYLGACYAAGGRDSEAAGAWQMALVTEDDARIVYDVLADALLRQGDAERAVEIIAEARGRWKDEAGFLPRLAVAQAMLKRGDEALATLAGYLQAHQADTEAAALAVRLVYEAHAAGRTVTSAAADRELAERYAAWYRAAGGANQALVDRWVAFIVKGQASGAQQ